METKKIGLLLVVLLVLLSNGIFTEVEKVEACKCVVCHYISPEDPCVFNCDLSCGVGSTCSDITHGCGPGDNTWPFSDSVCLIGGPYNRLECDDSVGMGCPANNSWNYCSENQCLATGPATDGDVCRVSTDATGCSFTEGVWDNSQGKCVRCPANNREMENCGDITGTHFDGVSCTGFNNAMFESACGADSACDEVVNTGDGCTIGLACENGGNPNCSGIDACDINGHCCIAPDVVDAVTGICITAIPCDCDAAPGNDGICCGSGCVATHNGDPDCTCAELGGTDCGTGSCDGATGSIEITNHNTMGSEVCCTGNCVGCSPTCFTGHCLISLANATITGDICCNGGECYECNSGFVWDSVLGICMPLGGGIPDMGHSTDHGNYFEYDKDVDLVFTEGAEFLLRIAGGLALFILVVGGLFYMVSGSSPDGQTKAKKIVTYAVIGLAIVLIAYVIVMVVEGIAV